MHLPSPWLLPVFVSSLYTTTAGTGASAARMCADVRRGVAARQTVESLPGNRCQQRTTDDLLQVEHGSLYPALHRLERKGWIAAKWEAAGKDLKREFKCYRLTPAGKKELVSEESNWKKPTGAIARIMWPAEET